MPSHPVRPPDWVDSAEIVIDNSVVIAARPSEVWEHIADHETWPEWFGGLDSVEPIGTGEGVGSGRTVRIGRLSIEEEFTAWEPGRRFAFSIVRSPMFFLDAMAEVVDLSGDEQRCTVRYRQGVQPKRYLAFLARPMVKRLDSGTKDALKALQRRAETGR